MLGTGRCFIRCLDSHYHFPLSLYGIEFLQREI